MCPLSIGRLKDGIRMPSTNLAKSIPAFVICATAFLFGCATAGQMNRLSLGMTKQQVIDVMGTPHSVAAHENTEYLNYFLTEDETKAYYGTTTPYFVRLINGKVDAYGRRGDFDSSK